MPPDEPSAAYMSPGMGGPTGPPMGQRSSGHSLRTQRTGDSSCILSNPQETFGVMALSEFERKRVEHLAREFCVARSPRDPRVWAQLHLDFDIENQSLILVEVRPDWKDSAVIRRSPFAKATYVRTTERWKVFWRRADLKWHTYDPMPTVARVELFLDLVSEDDFGCFFG